jgi:hypothetical protein
LHFAGPTRTISDPDDEDNEEQPNKTAALRRTQPTRTLSDPDDKGTGSHGEDYDEIPYSVSDSDDGRIERQKDDEQ